MFALQHKGHNVRSFQKAFFIILLLIISAMLFSIAYLPPNAISGEPQVSGLEELNKKKIEFETKKLQNGIEQNQAKKAN
jgi:hypothetical protein